MQKYNKAWVALIPGIVAVASLVGLDDVVNADLLTSTGEWVMSGLGLLTSWGVYQVANQA